MAVDVVLVGGLDEPALDDGALRGRAAHVERDQPVRAEHAREARAARGARRRAGLHRVHGLRPRGLERERAAVRLRDEDLAAEAAPGQRPAEGAEVAVHDGPDVGVDDRGARPLVLAPLLCDPMRGRDRRRRAAPAATISAARCSCAGSRYENRKTTATDSTPSAASCSRGRADSALVEGDQHLAARAEALRHLEATAPRHERRRPLVEHVVHPEEVAAADLEDVPETLGRDQAGQGPFALEEGIDADRRAVDHESAVGQPRAAWIDAAEHAVEEIARRAERLGGRDRAGRLVERDQVREGAADVDADPQGHATARRARGPRSPTRSVRGSRRRRYVVVCTLT